MIEQKLLEKTRDVIQVLYGQELGGDMPGLEKTRKEFEGDFTLVVFPLLKIVKKTPEKAAAELGEALKNVMPEIRDYTVIKGFLNIRLTDQYWLDFFRKNQSKEDYGFQKTRHEKPVVLEYSSPNTNKPLHLGHIRNNLLGNSLAELLKATGQKVIRVNLVNDRGIHICKSMLAYMKWGQGEDPVSSGKKGDHLIGHYYVLFDQHYKKEVRELTERGLTEEEAARQAPLIVEAQEVLRKWEARDPETIALWQRMNGWAYDGFTETYDRLGITFDKIYYESSTYLLGKDLVMDGLEKGILVRKEDGSIWADLRDEGLDEKVLLRADGTSVYMTQDLGTAQLRFDDFHPQSMIYVVGNEQNYHFDVLKRVLTKLGKEYGAHIFHLSYGMVELPQGKMKSREGTVVDADELMQEMHDTARSMTQELGKVDDFTALEAEKLFEMIGLGALKYFILKVDPKKNMMFDPRESIDFNGNTGPFIQYTHARIRSLLRRGETAGLTPVAITERDLNQPLLKPEKEILRLLYAFPQVLEQAARELSPAQLANYIFELAKEYNQFYQEIPVLKEENKALAGFRLALSAFTGDVLRRSMQILGIEVPERM
jgi:arginyl-tRNA synthetase